jgi:hypothetical protein
VSQHSHPSPLRVHLTSLVPSTATHNSLDLRLGLFTPPYALPELRVTSPSHAPHRASLSLAFLPLGKRPLLFVECFTCFPVRLPFILCFLFVYGSRQPLPFVMDTVDSFPLMTTCRYTLTLRLIVSEQ